MRGSTRPSLFVFAIIARYIMKGGLYMTYKQIEASREARLWIGQVIVPAATAVAIAMTNPELRRKTAEKINNIKTAVKNKLKKD